MFWRFMFCTLLIITFMTSCKRNFNYKKALRNWEGKQEMKKANYQEAETIFRENVIENPNVGQFHYNRANALYKSEEYEEALKEYQLALGDKNFLDKDKIYHNMGNTTFKTEKYTEALELYRKALIENPDNWEARKNYEIAQLLLQPQSEQQQDDQQNDEQDQKEEEQQQQQMQPQEKTPDQQEAERLLQALEQKQEQEKEEENKASGVRKGNFW